MFQGMMCGPRRTRRQLAGGLVLRGRDSAPVGRATLVRPLLHASIALFAFVSLPTLSAGINDTGISFCSDNNYNTGVSCSTVAADNGSNPRQNGRYGRDALAHAGKLTKIGNGSEGFDYTKIGNNGSNQPDAALLGTGANDWACTRDNVTGLTWEVKTSSGLRSQGYTYSWYSSDTTSNANYNTNPSLGSCETANTCDTEKFVAAVNFSQLCGASDWRMPTVKELEGLSDFGLINPAIDLNYFPNTAVSSPYWSGTASANLGDATSKNYAWVVNTTEGRATSELRYQTKFVRLVRGGL